MYVAHSNIGQPEQPAQPKKLSKKEAFHLEMVEEMRRDRYRNFLSALKKPEIKELIKKVQQVSPGWMPKFRG